MHENLYFIPLIAQALQDEDPASALVRVFDKVVALGRQPSHERGYAQFRRFMDAVVRHAETNQPSEYDLPPEVAEVLAGELAGDEADGDAEQLQDAIASILSHPQWHRVYEQVSAEIRSIADRPQPICVCIEKDGIAIAQVLFDRAGQFTEVTNIIAGQYEIQLDTGRMLWSGPLTEQDLEWSNAHPGRPLKAAADTAASQDKPTRRISLLDGALTLCVYPGPESGLLQIELLAETGSS